MKGTVRVPHREFCLRPIERPSLIEDYKIAEKYLERVRDTLKFGLWVVEDTADLGKPRSAKRWGKDDGRYKDTPGVARTCFTELKLSDARRHAYEYGRLGFGVKRTYLFRRAGRPMVYVGPQRINDGEYPNPIYPDWIARPRSDDMMALSPDPMAWSFVKFMSETEDLSFTYYSESEWRIICPHPFSNVPDSVPKFKEFKELVVDVDAVVNGDISKEVNKYLNRLSKDELGAFVKDKGDRLRYLLPLDFELAVIVYPSPEIKILAECDEEIRRLLRFTRNYNPADGNPADRFYENLDDRDYKGFLAADESSKKCAFCKLKKSLGATPKGGGAGERMMLPMEIDLDTMSHF
jgi:hypothetical protein